MKNRKLVLFSIIMIAGLLAIASCYSKSSNDQSNRALDFSPNAPVKDLSAYIGRAPARPEIGYEGLHTIDGRQFADGYVTLPDFYDYLLLSEHWDFRISKFMGYNQRDSLCVFLAQWPVDLEWGSLDSLVVGLQYSPVIKMNLDSK